MDRSLEKKSRKSREEHRDRDSTRDQKDRDRETDRDRHKHRTKDSHHHHHRPKDRDNGDGDRDDDYRRRKRREDSDDDEYHRSRARSHDRESRREKSSDEHLRSTKEYLEDRDSRRDREGSRERVSNRDSRREKSYEREGSRDRGREREEVSHSSKRKVREDSADQNDVVEKRIRVSDDSKEERKERRRFEDRVDGGEKDSRKEGRKERRKFEDRVDYDSQMLKEEVKLKKEDADEGNAGHGRRRENRRFGDKAVKVEVDVKEEDTHEHFDGAQSNAAVGSSGLVPNGGVFENHMLPRTAPDILAQIHPLPTKVSSITTTNENKGVTITGSHEVTGKSSTDGATTGAANSGNLSLDALAKAKKALQMQKELSEKLKKLPLLNKGGVAKADASPHLSSKEGAKPPSTVAILPTPSFATTITTLGGLGSVSAPPGPDSASASMKPLSGIDAAKYEAVKKAQELAAKMGFRQDPEFAPLINLFPGQTPVEVSLLQKPAKAPVLRLDALGREIDEHGNVVNVTKPNNLSTLKVNINKQKKDAFQILKPDLDVNPEENPHYDPRMGIDKSKLLRPKRMTFQFVEEGKWSREAEMIKLKSQFGEAQAKELKAKQVQLAKAKAEPNINPNLIEVSERVITKEKPKEPIPQVEWWDIPLLRSDTYPDIEDASEVEEKIKMEKITIYVEHPRPIEPPAEPAPPPPQPLKLTKKEQKKLRTQRRLAKEKERQEMIRQGLLEPPKPKVKMSNLMKVLGSEATQDPTKLEMEIRSAAAEREQAHVDRNIARKLTPAERREKKERKLFDDPNTLETIVSIYKVNDLSHPQNRFKVDVNAQENRLTGCVVIFEGFSVVVVEGGTKSIKRYGKLMLKRINWSAKVENEEGEDDEDEDKPDNKCVLVWQGSVAKPSFNKFLVHECRTEAASRKIFNDAGVGHYWDLAANFSDDQI
ncbi:Protein rdm16 [Dionaea muscipula]